MGVVKLLEEAQAIGLKVKIEGDRLVVRGPKSAEQIAKALLNHKIEVIELLTRPYINQRGELIISFESDPKYHYWKPGGQSIAETLHELNAPPDVWKRYVEGYTETKQ